MTECIELISFFSENEKTLLKLHYFPGARANRYSLALGGRQYGGPGVFQSRVSALEWHGMARVHRACDSCTGRVTKVTYSLTPLGERVVASLMDLLRTCEDFEYFDTVEKEYAKLHGGRAAESWNEYIHSYDTLKTQFEHLRPHDEEPQ